MKFLMLSTACYFIYPHINKERRNIIIVTINKSKIISASGSQSIPSFTFINEKGYELTDQNGNVFISGNVSDPYGWSHGFIEGYSEMKIFSDMIMANEFIEY